MRATFLTLHPQLQVLSNNIQEVDEGIPGMEEHLVRKDLADTPVPKILHLLTPRLMKMRERHAIDKRKILSNIVSWLIFICDIVFFALILSHNSPNANLNLKVTMTRGKIFTE